MTTLHRIGLIDFGDLPVPQTVEVAQLADTLGYSRFWLAEHYTGLAYRNSRLMTPIVAGTTRRIRVGPAGVLLRYYAPAAVADDGLFLASTFGDRIDLGLAAGRLPTRVAAAYADGRDAIDADERFPSSARLVGAQLDAQATARSCPELWVLGSSDRAETAQLAAEIDASFSLTLTLSPSPPSPRPLQAYRDARAHRGASGDTSTVMLSLACVASRRERSHFVAAHATAGASFVDTPAICRERLEELAFVYGASEITVLEASAGLERRRDSLQMLAEELAGSGALETSATDTEAAAE